MCIRDSKAILCVDNDLDTCEMLKALLGMENYAVDLASNFTEGLEKAKQGGYDLILLDWYYPNGTGVELCQTIRTFDKRTPIFFYTGEARQSMLQTTLEVGAQGYLVKPVDPDELLKTVHFHTRGL